MARRYIDADALVEEKGRRRTAIFKEHQNHDEIIYAILRVISDAIKALPTGDVVPRKEVDQLKATIDRLEQEKAEMLVSEIAEFHIPMEIAYRLRTEHPIFIAIKAEVAREIFAVLEDIFEEDEFYSGLYYDGYEGAIMTRDHIREKFAELKKKYLEGDEL